mmetsp:Transcript_97402/g.275414  ORF Transcript_97402/g.275414 Transcript_97402/m.275414 type:complete len:294 (+) Transcript_97402:1809-2690(+)
MLQPGPRGDLLAIRIMLALHGIFQALLEQQLRKADAPVIALPHLPRLGKKINRVADVRLLRVLGSWVLPKLASVRPSEAPVRAELVSNLGEQGGELACVVVLVWFARSLHLLQQQNLWPGPLDPVDQLHLAALPGQDLRLAIAVSFAAPQFSGENVQGEDRKLAASCNHPLRKKSVWRAGLCRIDGESARGRRLTARFRLGVKGFFLRALRIDLFRRLSGRERIVPSGWGALRPLSHLGCLRRGRLCDRLPVADGLVEQPLQEAVPIDCVVAAFLQERSDCQVCVGLRHTNFC